MPEIVAEKLRACHQRDKARDIFDLGMYATRPLDRALVRRLVVLKLWQARDTFDPARLLQKFQDGKSFDRDDLGQLVRKTTKIDPVRISADCVAGFRFLADLTPDEKALAADGIQRQHDLWARLRDEVSDSV